MALIGRRGYATLAPDLVAEILSPDDRPGEVRAKVREWLDAGVALAWVIDPERKMAEVHRANGSVNMLGDDANLDGESVLPGFSCRLAEVFE